MYMYNTKTVLIYKLYVVIKLITNVELKTECDLRPTILWTFKGTFQGVCSEFKQVINASLQQIPFVEWFTAIGHMLYTQPDDLWGQLGEHWSQLFDDNVVHGFSLSVYCREKKRRFSSQQTKLTYIWCPNSHAQHLILLLLCSRALEPCVSMLMV